jgi:flagellar motor switch protein FliM
MRKLRLRHAEFIRSLADQLSTYLRLEVALQMSSLETLTYEKFIEGLPSPTCLTLCKAEPLRGLCLLNLTPRLGLTLVDRLLGGSALSVNATAELSEIEIALLDQVSLTILKEWCQLWPKGANAPAAVLAHESNARFLNALAPDTLMLALEIEVRLGDCVEPLKFAFPFLAIQPLIGSQAEPKSADPAAPKAERPQWNPNLEEVPVRLHTEWHGLELSARALAGLKCGDMLMLQPTCFDCVEVRLEQSPKFHGRLGTSGERWAVELTDIIKT